jgi:hypothetical protein
MAGPAAGSSDDSERSTLVNDIHITDGVVRLGFIGLVNAISINPQVLHARACSLVHCVLHRFR